MLRSALDAAGFTRTQIVAGDVHSWAPAKTMLQDADLAKVVKVLGRHYPGSSNDPDSQGCFDKYRTPLWSSEDFASNNQNSGGRCEARIINQNWVSGNISATISWNLISSYYTYLAWSSSGMMTAHTPWSGHFSIDPPIFALAHTTLFAKPGWLLHPVGAGSGWLANGGSYVAYTNPGAGSDLTIVVEKVNPKLSSCQFEPTPRYNVSVEHVAFKLTGADTPSTLNVYWSNLAGTSSSSFLQARQSDIIISYYNPIL